MRQGNDCVDRNATLINSGKAATKHQSSKAVKQLRFASDFVDMAHRSKGVFKDATKRALVKNPNSSIKMNESHAIIPDGSLPPRFGRANELMVENTTEDSLVSETAERISSIIKAQRSWSKMCDNNGGKSLPLMCPSDDVAAHERDNFFGANAKASLYETATFRERLRLRTGPQTSGEGQQLLPTMPVSPISASPTRKSLRLPSLMISPTSAASINDSAGAFDSDSAHSPRSRFIKQLMGGHENGDRARKEELVTSVSSIIIRRTRNDHEINLSYQGIGDRLGAALACCLYDLPSLQRLNIRDNRLTDTSLAPILLAVHQCANLTSLDVGSNKMDTEASAAMGRLLARPDCPLLDLGLSKADVDDSECCQLISRLKRNENLTALDLSHNMIGGNSSGTAVDPSLPTKGVDAIARMLLRQRGNIKSLKLSWNSIRKGSSRRLGESLATNCTLVALDLSFNAFGDDGGLAIGGALFTNKTLRNLNLSNNSIQGRAAFTIAIGCRENSSLEVLDLRSNPIGQSGGRAFLSVPAVRGDRLTLHLECCNMTTDDPAFYFDRTTQLPREPVDLNNLYVLDLSKPHRRAVGLEVLRVVAAASGCQISTSTLDGRELSLDRKSISIPGSYGASIGTSQHDLLEQALRKINDIWKEYDADKSGHLNAEELRRLLVDLNLDSSSETLERVLTTYDCNKSGLLEKEELEEFLYAAKHAARERAKPRPVMVAASDPMLPFVLPLSGTFTIQVLFKPDVDLEPVRTTTLGELSGVIDLADKTDDRVEALHLACGQMKLQVEEAQQLANALLRDMADVVIVLARILPFMASASHAQVLVNLYLQDNAEERRRLEKELGPLFRPLMGYYTAHYVLDLSKPVHRAALLKIAENNSLESKQRRVDRARDTSQKGNWVNFRNESFRGKSIELRPSFFDPLAATGVVEFDYVSTARPKSSTSVMSNKRFIGLMGSLGWPLFDVARDTTLFEFLEKDPPEPKVLPAEDLFLFDRQIALLRGNKDVPGENSTGTVPPLQALIGSLDGDTLSSVQNSIEGANGAEPSAPALGGLAAAAQRMSNMPRQLSIMSSLVSMKHRATEVIKRQRVSTSRQDEMLKVRDLIYTRWFTCRQAQWILNHCPFITNTNCGEEGEGFNASAAAHGTGGDDEMKVELVVTLFSRIYDLFFFDLLLGDLSAPDRARVTHRLGWLNIFNPHRADLSYALDLREREDRLVAKLLVHLSVIEPGENVIEGQFAWDRCVDPVPGWALPQTWFRENGMPVKGSLKLQYFSGLNKRWADRSLRTALMDVVLASPLEDEQQAYLKEEKRGTADYIAHSLEDGCIAGCGVPITWTYDT